MAKHWSTHPAGNRPIMYNEHPASKVEPVTVMKAFEDCVKKNSSRPALKQKLDGKEWKTWTYQQYYDEVRMAAKGFIKLGLEAHQSVSIIGFNSPEWFIADIAAIFAGGMAAGIYTTNGADACHYIAEHSESVVAVVEGKKQLEKFLQIRSRLPHLKAIVVYGETDIPASEGVYLWDDFLKLSNEVPDSELTARIEKQKPENCCTLIYTSGTTGNPKAVMITHDNCTWTASTVVNLVKISTETQIISFLPLSHIAAQMVDIHAAFFHGGTVWFAQPDALKGSLATTMKEVRPTVFFGVPRVWEKMMEKMKSMGASTKGLKKTLVTWAKAKGLAAYYADMNHRSHPWFFGLAKSLVLDKVRVALGLDRCKFALTGAAPITAETLEYFGSLNIPIYEIFGMSESSGPQTISIPSKFKIRSCGPATPGAEMMIANPDANGEGEVCFRGRHIMLGYLKDEKNTAETIDEQGWLHSGDVGKIVDGFLYITGRIKELIITAGGENIPPVPIEDVIRGFGPAISNIMVVGDKKKFLTCLVALKTQPLDDGSFNNLLTADSATVDPDCKTVEDAMKSAKWKKYIETAISQYNKGATSNAQKVQKFRILPLDFSIPTGELTPTLKLKRKVVATKYENIIEEMYSEGGNE